MDMEMSSTAKKIYDLLLKHEHLRNNDKPLMFTYWKIHDKAVKGTSLDWENFKKRATMPETIRRYRQELQSKFSEVEPTDPHVRKTRGFREKEFHKKVKSDVNQLERDVKKTLF